jgi:hypothetical protein
MRRYPVTPMVFLQCAPRPRRLGVGLLPFSDLPFSGGSCVCVWGVADVWGPAFRGSTLRCAMALLGFGPWLLL